MITICLSDFFQRVIVAVVPRRVFLSFFHNHYVCVHCAVRCDGSVEIGSSLFLAFFILFPIVVASFDATSFLFIWFCFHKDKGDMKKATATNCSTTFVDLVCLSIKDSIKPPSLAPVCSADIPKFPSNL